VSGRNNVYNIGDRRLAFAFVPVGSEKITYLWYKMNMYVQLMCKEHTQKFEPHSEGDVRAGRTLIRAS